MTSELRPAVAVWDDAIDAWAADTIDTRQAAAAVIEADREAVRAAVVTEICEWLRKDDHAGWWIMLADEVDQRFGGRDD